MTYCTKCGAKNEDDAAVCVKCGASLTTGKYPTRRHERRRYENECFGIPQGGRIVGLIIGLIIIIAGVSWLMGYQFWNIFWPLIVIIIGVLIVVGALYRYVARA